MKILVTGGRGLLGSELGRLGRARRAGAGGGTAVRGTPHPDEEPLSPRPPTVVALGRQELDVTDADDARRVIADHAPDWVVHCAAYTGVDRAEEEPEAAMRVNHGGTVNVATAATEIGAGLVYLSTDYVFDGRDAPGGAGRTPYRPDDPVAPLSAYARTKLAGEEAALASGGVAVRTGWLYGAGGRNFVDAILERAERGESLRVVDDQRGRPTWARNVATGVVELLEGASSGGAGGSSGAKGGSSGGAGGSSGGKGERLAGVWHLADGGDATWLELAREALRLRGLDVEVEGVSTEEWGAAAPRPAYSVLDVSSTEARLGRPMVHWREALERYLSEQRDGRAETVRSSTKEHE